MEQLSQDAAAEESKLRSRQQFAKLIENGTTAVIVGASKYASPERNELSVTPRNFACPIAS